MKRAQLRMSYCWEQLTDTFDNNQDAWHADKRATKYLSAMKKTSARVYTSGLGLALLFLKSRGGESLLAYEHLSRLCLKMLLGPAANGDLLTVWQDAPDKTFPRLASEECIEIINVLAYHLQGAGVTAADEEEEEETIPA